MLIATYEDLEIDRDHVLLHLVAHGRWNALVDDLRHGAACAAMLDDVDLQAASRQAEQRFRTGRGLHAADDLRAWLAERRLDVGAWRSHLRRRAAADVWAVRSPDDGPHDPAAFDDLVTPDDVDVAVVVDGVLDEATRWLLEGAAAHDAGVEVDRRPAEDRRDRLALVEAAPLLRLDHPAIDDVDRRLDAVLFLDDVRRAAGSLVGDREVRASIAERSLEWTVLEFDDLALPSFTAAKEAVMCVRDDGLDLTEVGERCGRPVVTASGAASELPSFVTQTLIAGMVGRPSGPVEGDGAWHVMVLKHRFVPDPDDASVVAAARDDLVCGLLGRQLAGRVVFHAAV